MEENSEFFRIVRLDRARNILCQMFNVDKYYLENNTCRKRNVIDARRFLVYYMNRELEIPYNRLQDYIKGMHHATGIHLCRTFEDFTIGRTADVEMRNNYHKFIVLANDFDILETMLKIKRGQAKHLNQEIKEINNQIKEKRNENNSES
tara:strand:- start:284 stop:730 length:447 start_codon:yes stop_codon:yes gene_type:complete